MPNNPHKTSERKHARALGLERNRPTGFKGDPDYEEPKDEDGLICYQHKHGYDQPGYMLDWLLGICAWAAKTNRLGAVVWHRKGGKMKDSLVVMRFEDWVQLHGGPK